MVSNKWYLCQKMFPWRSQAEQSIHIVLWATSLFTQNRCNHVIAKYPNIYFIFLGAGSGRKMGDGERPMGMANGTENLFDTLGMILKHDIFHNIFSFRWNSIAHCCLSAESFSKFLFHLKTLHKICNFVTIFRLFLVSSKRRGIYYT